MKVYHQPKALAVPGTIILAVFLALVVPLGAQAQTNTLTNGLVAYWPMDVVTNGTTPDLSHGYDMTLQNVQATNFIPSSRGTIGTLSGISAGNAVSFSSAQHGFLYYLGTPGDFLPINLQSNYTINMWISIVGSNQSDLRIFAEDDFNGNSNPLWVVGTGGGGGSSEDANLHWLMRHQSISINGSLQEPDVDVTQNQAYTSLNPCDGNWHMVTITKQCITNVQGGTNVVNYEVYVDTVRDPGNTGSALYPANDLDAFGTNAVIPYGPWLNTAHTNLSWTWLINATSFGGLSRSLTGGNYITGQLDDAAMWDRALTTNEIVDLYENGLTDVVSTVAASISDFSFDVHQVLYGDTVTLRWTTAHATSLAISPSIGNVTSISVNGSGSTKLTITADATYTLIASRPGSSVTNTASVTVSRVPVAPNWHVIENFAEIPPTNGVDIPELGWDNVLGDYTGPLDTFNITSLANTNPAVTISNDVCGTSQSPTPRGALSTFLLNSLTVQTNMSNTVFFRVYLDDTNTDDFSFFLGVNDVNLSPLAVQIYEGAGAGPRINIQRTATGTGGVVDVMANDGVAGFDVIEDGETNAASTQMLSTTVPTGLTPGVVYDFWIDIFDKPFGFSTNSDGSTNTSGTLYSVYYKPLGAPTRTLLFTNLLSDRSPFGAVPPALPALGQIFLLMDAQVYNVNLLAGGTNSIFVDNLYMSRSGINATIPVAPGVFPDLIVPTSIGLEQPAYLQSDPSNGNNPSVTLTWSSIPGATYTVYKSSSLDGPAPWQLVTTELPSTGSTLSYTDISISSSTAFYKVSSP
jgi:hypothetical protein